MVLCGPWICLKNKYLQKWQKKQNKIKIFQKSLEDCEKRSGKKQQQRQQQQKCFYSQDMRTSCIWYCLMFLGAKAPSPDQQRLLRTRGVWALGDPLDEWPCVYLKASWCYASVKAKPCSLEHTKCLLVCPGPFSSPLMDVYGIGIAIPAGSLLWSEIKL